MWENIISKIKKYLLFISILFFVVIWWHLIYQYLYQNAQEIPVKWGTISEGIIGDMPHLNPLLPSSDYNKYINSILYRSLLTYDIVNEKIISDLASCDISNLSYIECYLENNLLWSNGDPITPDDIIATLNIIEKTNVNPWISALLEGTTINASEWKITFNNSKKDINFLNIFFQPILPKVVIDNLWESSIKGNFSPIGWIYSWRYLLSSVTQDETVGITKMTLSKNTNYFQNDAYVDSIIFKIFDNNAHFLKHKSSINIFNDKENIVWNSIPRLQNTPYTLPQFVWIFLNQETLTENSIREEILQSISRDIIIEKIWVEKVEPIMTPYLSWDTIDTVSERKNIEDIVQRLWYFSKKELIKKTMDLAPAEENSISQEAKIQEVKEIKQQETLQYITSPTKQKYNFISEDNILLQGNVTAEVESVYVNDYKLQGFTQWDDVFYYRLLESYDSIIEWENIYNIYFEINGEKKLQEQVVYIYYTDSEKLKNIESNYFQKSQNKTIITEENSEESSTIDIQENSEKESINIDVDSLDNLDPRFFYTVDGDAFKIRLVYINSDTNIEITAQEIKNQLDEKWIFIELIPLSLAEVTKWLRDETLQYDAILIGINLGYFDFNLFPYFHSSQVKNGYNFSNFKQLWLDILLEELKSNNLSTSKKSQLKEKVTAILQEASIMKTLYRPTTNFLVDQNLKGFSFNKNLPDEIYRFSPLIHTYISKKKIIDFEEKSFIWFWKFLLTSLF